MPSDLYMNPTGVIPRLTYSIMFKVITPGKALCWILHQNSYYVQPITFP
uniref:Uncharacterized protein n=1 Tax=Anguilla anguilla TaxID=7936 RepID=A0A0E9XLS9_ANGAN